MAGVEADADARRAVEMIEDRREVLEAMAQRAALSRRVFEQDHRLAPRPRFEGVRESPRRSAEARRLRSPTCTCPDE